MKSFLTPSYLTVSLMLCLFISSPVQAHFGMVIPDQSIINQDNKDTTITLSFSHPFENHTMNLSKPNRFFVAINGETQDLSNTLEKINLLNHTAWTSSYSFKRPGVYQFVMEPVPYWEPTEDVSIIHYTKTIIPAFGDDQGWDQPVGLPTEIVPLLRPFGNYAGNSFTGQVLVNGAPAPNVDVEVELYNPDSRYTAPSDYHVTQLVKTNKDGIFTFTCPLPGWWGFAALTEADYTLKDPDGKEKGVELGAVLWTYFHPLSSNN
ncbi:MAG: ATP-dependent DNA ligase [Desulfotalea sp.]|nr:MAG: ATP-dependent DNA ligase [Desulfotalea sp.]